MNAIKYPLDTFYVKNIGAGYLLEIGTPGGSVLALVYRNENGKLFVVNSQMNFPLSFFNDKFEHQGDPNVTIEKIYGRSHSGRADISTDYRTLIWER